MIELKFFERADFPQLISWIETPELLLQWGGPNFSFPLDNGQLEAYLSNANERNSASLIFSVLDKELDKIIGHAALGKIDRTNKSARVGKVLIGDKNARGKGIGEKIMTDILKIAFDDLSLHRVSLGVFDFNSSAITCYEKVGFKKEGLLRESRKIGEEYWSLWEMSILDNEWENIKTYS